MVKLSSSQLFHLSEKLVALREIIPSEFARRPCSLVELDQWKATEYSTISAVHWPCHVEVCVDV